MSQKAKNLEHLYHAGITVPKGFTLGADHYSAMLKPLAHAIIKALPSAQHIRDLFLMASLPTVSQGYLDFALSSIPNADTFAVRSSGIVKARGKYSREDDDTVSLAGQFDSFLNVPRDQVPEAVKMCWASLFNERSIARFGANDDYVRESVMSVIVQEMIPAHACAVMMTVDPQSTGEVGAIEFALGPCEAIVAGIVSPDEVIFARSTGRIVSSFVGRKECKLVYEPFDSRRENTRRVATTSEEQRHMSVGQFVIEEMIRIGHQIELLFGKPQDIEAVITVNDQIVITQARPVSTLPRDITPFTLALSSNIV